MLVNEICVTKIKTCFIFITPTTLVCSVEKPEISE